MIVQLIIVKAREHAKKCLSIIDTQLGRYICSTVICTKNISASIFVYMVQGALITVKRNICYFKECRHEFVLCINTRTAGSLKWVVWVKWSVDCWKAVNLGPISQCQHCLEGSSSSCCWGGTANKNSSSSYPKFFVMPIFTSVDLTIMMTNSPKINLLTA